MSPLLSLIWIAFELSLLSLTQSQVSFRIYKNESSYPFAGYLRDYILIGRILDEDGISWSDANEYCQNQFDSNLATIITRTEYELAYNISYYGGLIGLNDIDENGQFSWIDGTPCYITNGGDAWNTNASYCSDWFIPSNDPVQKCMRTGLPPGTKSPSDWNCSITYRQWYCNKGMIITFKFD